MTDIQLLILVLVSGVVCIGTVLILGYLFLRDKVSRKALSAVVICIYVLLFGLTAVVGYLHKTRIVIPLPSQRTQAISVSE